MQKALVVFATNYSIAILLYTENSEQRGRFNSRCKIDKEIDEVALRKGQETP